MVVNEPGSGSNVDSAVLAASSRAEKVTLAGYEVEGISISGQETCIIIPKLKAVFDSGRCPQKATFQQTLFLTHGHLDHVGGIPFHVTSRIMARMAPSQLILHPACEANVHRMLSVVQDLQGGADRCRMEYEVVPLPLGQQFKLPSGFFARPFATVHPVPSQGYVIYSQRNRLKAELQGKSQAEVKARKMAGEEVTEVVEVPEVAFTGDTTVDFLDEHPRAPWAEEEATTAAAARAAAAMGEASLNQAATAAITGRASIQEAAAAEGKQAGKEDAEPASHCSTSASPAPAARSSRSMIHDLLHAKLLIMEMTYIDGSLSPEEARERGHMHIDSLVANAERFQNEAILLIHFSPRHSRQEILDALEKKLPPCLKSKVVPFLNGFA